MGKLTLGTAARRSIGELILTFLFVFVGVRAAMTDGMQVAPIACVQMAPIHATTLRCRFLPLKTKKNIYGCDRPIMMTYITADLCHQVRTEERKVVCVIGSERRRER